MKITQVRKWQIIGMVCLFVTALTVLYSQNIILPNATQESVNNFYISLVTACIAVLFATFVSISINKRGVH